MMIEFKGSHFERDVILWGVRWYMAYPISYRQLEEMMDERGVEVDHSTLNRWVVKYVPLLEKQFRARKRPEGSAALDRNRGSSRAAGRRLPLSHRVDRYDHARGPADIPPLWS